MGASLSSNSKFIIDTGGNVGIGVIPENSSGTWRNFEQGGMNLAARANNAVDGMIGTNYVFETDNSEVYKTSAATSRIFFDANELKFQQAASGTAGNTISWSTPMKIDSSGNIVLSGVTSNTTVISLDTSDGSDTKQLSLAGGGADSDGRGGRIRLYGNEHASLAGDIDIGTGNVANAQMDLRAKGSMHFYTDSTESMNIDVNHRIGMGVTPLGIAGYTKGQLELGSTDGGILILTDSNTTTDKNVSL